jgi:ribonuclease T2
MGIKANVIGLSMVLASAPAAVFADLGDFAATKTCPATKSIKKGDNPGRITVKPRQTYTAIQLNKPGGDYVLLRIPGASPEQRWVELTCGQLVNTGGGGTRGGDGTTGGGGTAGGTGGTSGQSKSGEFLLAASWQPAFCETSAGQSKEECDTETADRYDASHFTLHGLWPQPQTNVYCAVPTRDKENDGDHDWDALPEPALSAGTRADLDKVMPGTVSKLHRHEWIKHGTCFGTGPESYFRTAEALMDQLNASKLQELIAANIGKKVAAADLQAAFEETFGPGSAGALAIECGKDGKRMLISGVSIKLKGVLDETTQLRSALDTSAHPRPKCLQGVVDPVGRD